MPVTTHRETDPTGLRLSIEQDEYPTDPRGEWDFVGTMVCWHGRYNLGDAHNYPDPQAYRSTVGDDILELPLYLYDHSGLTIATTPFSCPWDSGQVGWTYVERRKALAAFDRRRLSPGLRAAILGLLRSEVAVYDQWLRGDVWRAVIHDRGDDLIDACSGIYGEGNAITEGRAMLAAAAADERERQATDFASIIALERPDLAPFQGEVQ